MAASRTFKRRNGVRLRVIFLATIFGVVISVLAVGKEIIRSREMEREIRALEAEAARIAARNRGMLDLREKLQDAEFIEREARQKIGFQKPGETVVVVNGLGPFPDSAGGVEPAESPAGGISNPERWRRYFFGQIQSPRPVP